MRLSIALLALLVTACSSTRPTPDPALECAAGSGYDLGDEKLCCSDDTCSSWIEPGVGYYACTTAVSETEACGSDLAVICREGSDHETCSDLVNGQGGYELCCISRD